MEVLPHAGDEPHAGVEAGNDEDGRDEHQPRPAEQVLRQGGEHLGTGGKARVHRTGLSTGVAQHGVDGQQQPARDEPGADGAPLHGRAFGDAPGPDVQRDHRPEVQPGQGVHGLVAVQDALGGGQGSVFRAGRGIVGRQRVGKAPGEQHHDQPDQAGAEDAAQ